MKVREWITRRRLGTVHALLEIAVIHLGQAAIPGGPLFFH
jgi:hypothetical protein